MYFWYIIGKDALRNTEGKPIVETLLTWLLLPWWFALPGYVANFCPGITRALPGGKIPISLRYLGPNKTILALPGALAGASIVSFLQSHITYPHQYPSPSWWTVAWCFGLGSVLGDWSKSFMKRRMGAPPGTKWFVEKFDFLVGSFLLLAFAHGTLPIHYYIVPIVFMLLVHGPGNRMAYSLGWRNSPH